MAKFVAIFLLSFLILVIADHDRDHDHHDKKKCKHKPGPPPNMDVTKPPKCNKVCDEAEPRHGRGKHDNEHWKKYFEEWRKHYKGQQNDRPHHEGDDQQHNERLPPPRPEGNNHNGEEKQPRHEDHDRDWDDKEMLLPWEVNRPLPIEKECENGMIFMEDGCPICECSKEDICDDVKCPKKESCHVFKEKTPTGEMKLVPRCVHHKLIESEELGEHRGRYARCFRIFKFVIPLIGLIVFIIIFVSCVCCFKKSRARKQSQRIAASKAMEAKRNEIACTNKEKMQLPAYFISPIIEEPNEEKVEPTFFVSAPPATPPPGYTSRSVSVTSLKESEKKKMDLPDAC